MAGRSLLLAALALALPAAAALAADPPAQPAQPTQPAQQPRLICRGGERQLGSHVRSTRRCRTAEEWRQEEEDSSRVPLSLQTTAGQNDGHAPANPR